MMRESSQTCNGTFLIRRFWRSASGFWRDSVVWFLVILLITIVVLQLAVQYWLNIWNRDFFNALEQKDAATLGHLAQFFLLLAGTSLALAIVSVWGRMTLQRQWREWLSRLLIDRWLRNDSYRRLRLMRGEHVCPEYRIADDARLATDAPIDLSLGLLSSVLSAVTFFSVLWAVGGNLSLAVFGTNVTLPGYLVIAAVTYSAVLTVAMVLIGGRLPHVIEHKNQAEADFKSRAALLSHEGTGARRSSEELSVLNSALAQVVVRWRQLCLALIRTTCVSHLHSVVAPVLALVLCIPKYVGGEMTLGEVAQAAAAFVIVQGALNWFADNYQRLADLFSSVKRVSVLLIALDNLDQLTSGPVRPVALQPAESDCHFSGKMEVSCC